MARLTRMLLFLTCLASVPYQTAKASLADVPATPVDDEPISSMDELIVNAANSSQEFEFFYDSNAQFVKVEYDMVYSYDEYAEIERLNNAANKRKKRTAGIINGRGGGRRWTNNVVPYQFANVFSGRDRTQLNAAIADWEKFTCLDFRQASSGNRIYFNNGGGCYSRVGMVGGAQTVGLAPGCRTKGVIIHEVGHALGLHHEQTRPDRDQHVRIISNNIPSRVLYNFQKQSWNVILNMGIPYDYTSIMHYGKTAFSTNGRMTIQTIDPKYQNVIGNRHALSFSDIKSINIMYNCKRHRRSCTKTDSDCPGEGFVGKDCTCWCPGGSLRNPTKSCSGGGGTRGTTPTPVTRRPTPRPTGCRDQNSNCAYWASRGECRRTAGYMRIYCKQSCNLCDGGGTTRPRCNDLHYNCPRWRRQGFCNRGYTTYMRSNCKSSCGLCGRSTEPSGCSDENGQCAYWASRGECHANPAYMLQACKVSCHQCNAASDVVPQRICRDMNSHCSFWSGIDECTKNPHYMGMVCKQSCGVC